MTNKVQKKVDARAYNHNQDSFTIENVIRWFDYWRERPGTGDRVSSGGVKSSSRIRIHIIVVWRIIVVVV